MPGLFPTISADRFVKPESRPSMFINIFYHQNIAYINLYFCATYLDNRWFINEGVERKPRILKNNISLFMNICVLIDITTQKKSYILDMH